MDPVKETIKVYDKFANEWSKCQVDVSQVEYIFKEFIPLLPGKNILDVGCGPGREAKYFISKGFEYTGLELSKEILELAKKIEPKAKYVFGDMRKMPFLENQFDGILCLTSIIHIPKNEVNLVLKEFNRVLKPNGAITLAIKLGAGERFEKIDRFGNLPRYYAFYEEQEFLNLLVKNGFKIVNSYSETKPSGQRLDKNLIFNIFAIKN